LQAIYKTVDDVDLFVGGLLETREEGILGPTFLCLVGDQFQRIKSADRWERLPSAWTCCMTLCRFWYENSGEQAFTAGQLGEVKKVSLARVLCDNVEDMEVIQPLAMQTPDVLNRRESCESSAIPRVDFGRWAS